MKGSRASFKKAGVLQQSQQSQVAARIRQVLQLDDIERQRETLFSRSQTARKPFKQLHSSLCPITKSIVHFEASESLITHSPLFRQQVQHTQLASPRIHVSLRGTSLRRSNSINQISSRCLTSTETSSPRSPFYASFSSTLGFTNSKTLQKTASSATFINYNNINKCSSQNSSPWSYASAKLKTPSQSQDGYANIQTSKPYHSSRSKYNLLLSPRQSAIFHQPELQLQSDQSTTKTQYSHQIITHPTTLLAQPSQLLIKNSTTETIHEGSCSFWNGTNFEQKDEVNELETLTINTKKRGRRTKTIISLPKKRMVKKEEKEEEVLQSPWQTKCDRAEQAFDDFNLDIPENELFDRMFFSQQFTPLRSISPLTQKQTSQPNKQSSTNIQERLIDRLATGQ